MICFQSLLCQLIIEAMKWQIGVGGVANEVRTWEMKFSFFILAKEGGNERVWRGRMTQPCYCQIQHIQLESRERKNR